MLSKESHMCNLCLRACCQRVSSRGSHRCLCCIVTCKRLRAYVNPSGSAQFWPEARSSNSKIFWEVAVIVLQHHPRLGHKHLDSGGSFALPHVNPQRHVVFADWPTLQTPVVKNYADGIAIDSFHTSSIWLPAWVYHGIASAVDLSISGRIARKNKFGQFHSKSIATSSVTIPPRICNLFQDRKAQPFTGPTNRRHQLGIIGRRCTKSLPVYPETPTESGCRRPDDGCGSSRCCTGGPSAMLLSFCVGMRDLDSTSARSSAVLFVLGVQPWWVSLDEWALMSWPEPHLCEFLVGCHSDKLGVPYLMTKEEALTTRRLRLWRRRITWVCLLLASPNTRAPSMCHMVSVKSCFVRKSNAEGTYAPSFELLISTTSMRTTTSTLIILTITTTATIITTIQVTVTCDFVLFCIASWFIRCFYYFRVRALWFIQFLSW